jgi:hypothetical protein
LDQQDPVALPTSQHIQTLAALTVEKYKHFRTGAFENIWVEVDQRIAGDKAH